MGKVGPVASVVVRSAEPSSEIAAVPSVVRSLPAATTILEAGVTLVVAGVVIVELTMSRLLVVEPDVVELAMFRLLVAELDIVEVLVTVVLFANTETDVVAGRSKVVIRAIAIMEASPIEEANSFSLTG